METIKVVAVPEGEAPLWVRKAWVGCVLLAEKGFYLPGKGITFWAQGREVLTDQMTDPMQEWFWVSRERAIEMLKVQGRSNAAVWWQYVCPMPKAEMLLFKPEECEVIILD